MPEGLTRGHKKRARTLEDLLDAATRVFSRKDAILTTFMEIANEARVASGTVHNYFKSKDELIEAASAKLVDRVNDRVAQMFEKAKDPAERVSIMVRAALFTARDDPEWGAAVLRLVSATHRTSEKLSNLVPEVLEDGRKKKRVAYRCAIAARDLVSGAILSGMRSVHNGVAPEEMGEHLAEHVLLALGVKPAEAAEISHRPLPWPTQEAFPDH